MENADVALFLKLFVLLSDADMEKSPLLSVFMIIFVETFGKLFFRNDFCMLF